MASRDVLGCYARMLERVAGRCGVTRRDLPPRQKILPLGAIGRTYGDRMLAIGDAAGLVKPTTGGGIHYSIVSAALAADVAVGALASESPRRRTPCPPTSGRGARSSPTSSPRSTSCAMS